jgi:hypothetical protein
MVSYDTFWIVYRLGRPSSSRSPETALSFRDDERSSVSRTTWPRVLQPSCSCTSASSGECCVSPILSLRLFCEEGLLYLFSGRLPCWSVFDGVEPTVLPTNVRDGFGLASWLLSTDLDDEATLVELEAVLLADIGGHNSVVVLLAVLSVLNSTNAEMLFVHRFSAELIISEPPTDTGSTWSGLDPSDSELYVNNRTIIEY